VSITAATHYVVSYHTNSGQYADDTAYFATTGFDNPPLHALKDGVDGANGVYLYSNEPAFPILSFQATNYWVDVVFTPANTDGDKTPPSLVSQSPRAGATAVSLNSVVTAEFSEAVQQATVSFSLTTAVNGLSVPATIRYDSSKFTLILTPNAPLQPATIYSAAVTGAADAAGNVMSPVSWSFTTSSASPVSACPCSIWSPDAKPAVTSFSDARAIELGVKFRSDSNGFITSIRFYKGSTNTGVHIGSLWDAKGTLLARATFTNESTSGWQQVNFSSPVAVTQGTTYVASYHTNTGHYAGDNGFFASSGVDSGPLHALAEGADGGNGVYAYSTSPMFPSSTYKSTNYWVDVVFATEAVACPCTLWPPTAAPANAGFSDSRPIEVGVKFRADLSGFITAIRYYKSSDNSGIHVGSLWSATGALLARATFIGETGSGWQQVNLSSPVAVTAGVTYVASYHTSTGHYSGDNNYFSTAGVDSGPLHALKDGTAGGNGVYVYAADSAFPNNTYKSTNYWVDVVFTSSPIKCPCTIWPSTAVPVIDANENRAIEVGVKFRSDLDGVINGIRFYKSVGNTGPHVGNLWTADGKLIASAGFTNETASGWQQVNFSSPVTIRAGTAYVASYHTDTGRYAGDNGYFANAGMDNGPLHALKNVADGGNGLYSYSVGSTFPTNRYKSTNYWVDVVFTPASSNCPCTLWNPSVKPFVSDFQDKASISVGVKFQSDVSGFITGLRFYKPSTNTDTHVGHIWSADGVLLATATFANETASGWQQVNLSTPLAINSRTVYIASYDTSSGHYAADNSYFANLGVDKPPLHAPRDGDAGGNGIYTYGAGGVFPNRSYKSTNYWVDVVFQPLVQ
jgi:hypothetical protein